MTTAAVTIAKSLLAMPRDQPFVVHALRESGVHDADAQAPAEAHAEATKDALAALGSTYGESATLRPESIGGSLLEGLSRFPSVTPAWAQVTDTWIRGAWQTQGQWLFLAGRRYRTPSHHELVLFLGVHRAVLAN